MLIFTLEVCKTGLCSGVCVCVSFVLACVDFHIRQEILGQDAATEEERCSDGDAKS